MTDEEFFEQPSLTRITGNNYYNSLCFADVACLLQEEESEEENDDEESEEEDLSLYERKRCVVENEDIPMDISDSEDDDDELPDVPCPCLQRMDSCFTNYELAPCRLFPELDEDENDENDEEPESYTCLHGVSMTSRDPTVCDECNELQEVAVVAVAVVAEDIPMDISDSDDDLLLLSKPIKIQRQNTICGLNIATGYAIYNGNPNGDRLLDEDEDEDV